MNIWHTDTLTAFTNKLYEGLLTSQHIMSNELVKNYMEKPIFGYVLEKENPETSLKDRYYVRTVDVEKLPIKVLKENKFSFRSEVFRMVIQCETKQIPSRKDMTFKEMVDFFADYQHSNPYHWRLAKIIVLVAYIERINIRIVSEASFGKDGLVNILRILNGGVSNLYGATLAKMKFALNNDLVIINELGDLKKVEISDMMRYLLQVGAFQDRFENPSRKVQGTQEGYDLRQKSHIVYHNTPDYYLSKGQIYFEQMFTPAVMDRFPALLLQGYVTEDFSKPMSVDDISEEDKLKSFIANLNGYKKMPVLFPKYSVSDDFWGFVGIERQRPLRTFTIIAKYLAEYSQTESEFITYCEILKKARFDYINLVNDDNRIMIEEMVNE